MDSASATARSGKLLSELAQSDMSFNLDGKVALVTGAGRGIGKAIAIAYARSGAAICCVARTLSEVQNVALEIEQAGGRSIAVSADVRTYDAVDQAFSQTSREFGGIDIVVINAGINASPSLVEQSDPEAWRDTLETNLLGAFYCARSAVPHLRRRGAGKIITVGSGLGHRGVPARSAYSCSKAALWMLTRVLAQELAQYNISVNELIPGPVQTSLTPAATQSSLGESEWFKSSEDVVPLALFLATQPDFGPTAQSFSLMRRDG